MSPRKSKANYGALFNTGATLQSGAFSNGVSGSLPALTEDEITHVQQLSLDVLLNNPHQPREEMNEEALLQLTQTIQNQGFQGVLVARPHPTQEHVYQITAGHRRREAAKKAGLATLPVVIKDITDQDMAALAVTENIQREDLTPLEEGKIFSTMMETMEMTLEQVAVAVGKSESYVRNRRRVAQAPEDIQRMVTRKPDSLRAVFYLLKVEDLSVRTSIIEMVVQGQLTADQVDQYVKTLGQQEHISSQQMHRSLTPEGSLPGVLSVPSSLDGRVFSQDTVATTPVQESDTKKAPASDRQIPLSSSIPTITGEKVIAQKQSLVGVSKLKTVLKTIQTYAQAVSVEQSLSREEAELIDRIIEVTQQIRHSASKDTQ